MHDYADLHGPHLGLLRAALAAASPPGARSAIDLGCGAGGKTPWLAAICEPDARVLGLDLDRAALAAAKAGVPGARWAAGDALNLPVRPGAAELIWCVAALGLFADQGRALRETAGALAHGGVLVVASAGERWVRPRRWPPGFTLPPGPPPPPADDLGGELGTAMAAAGLGAITLTAYLLEPAGLEPAAALLPLADLAPSTPLSIEEPEPLPILLVATGRRSLPNRKKQL